jgi:LPXTG-motif cell wall-anchored protein
MVAVERHQDGAACVHLLHDSDLVRHRNEVVSAKRLADAEQQTGKKVLSNVTEGKTDDDTYYSRTAQNGERTTTPLPVTGSDSLSWVQMGIALIALGAVLVYLTRRRSQQAALAQHS